MSSNNSGENSTSTIEDVKIESNDPIFIKSVNNGVEEENLDYPTLFLWSGLGIVIVTVLIVALIFFS